MRGSPKLAFASAAVVAIAGLAAGCGSSSKTTATAATPSAAVSTMPGSRSWSMTITDGGHSFSAMFTLGPVQKLSAYPGGFAALKARCEAASGLHFSINGDARARQSYRDEPVWFDRVREGGAESATVPAALAGFDRRKLLHRQ